MGSEVNRIKEYVVSLVRSLKGLRIDETIIFGSRVRGDYIESSDLDLILVSDDFEGIPFTDRITRVWKRLTSRRRKYPLEILCYTKAEYERKRKISGLVRDAAKEGVHLKSRG